MATGNVLTEADILKEIERATSQSQQDNKPKIKVGDQEFSVDNAQGIQDAINNSLSKHNSDYETLRTQVEQLSRGRVIEPELTDKSPVTQTQTQTALPTPKRPRDISDEEWAQSFVKSPRQTLDETIGRMLGIEGSGIQAIQNAFNTLAQKQQTFELANAALLQKAQELDKKIGETQAKSEAQNFIDNNPDFEINAQNRAVMEQYLTEYGLSPSEKNLELVFTKAKIDGKIQAKQEQTPQNQQFQPTQPQLRQGMPRLGGTSGSNMDDNYVIQNANKLPLDDHLALIQRLRDGNFQR